MFESLRKDYFFSSQKKIFIISMVSEPDQQFYRMSNAGSAALAKKMSNVTIPVWRHRLVIFVRVADLGNVFPEVRIQILS